MNNYVKLAWRNIWRNKRRTFITTASILFAVLLASLMESLQKGAWDHMINNVVNFYYGYIQIHEKGYWDDRTINKAIPVTPELDSILSENKDIFSIVPRLESFALAAAEENTLGVLIVGTLPEQEEAMTGLRERISEGEYFREDEQAVLVASGVAENLGLELHDTLVLISQGYHGVNAAGKYPIKGIVNFGSPELNKQMVYLPLKEAQWFFGAEGLVTSIALHLEDRDDMNSVLQFLHAKLDPEEYEIMDWKEMLPDLVEAKTFDSVGNYIVYFILYLIIAFGILGTVLMMVKEREYELGILLSIGMRRWRLGFMIWLEIFFIGILGALAGILLSIPVATYFKVHPIRFGGTYGELLEKFGFEPIFPATVDVRVFLLQALIVFIITTAIAFYPLVKTQRLNPVEAMRS